MSNAMADVHWVDSPEDQGEATNGTEESLGLAVLVGDGRTAVDSQLVDDDEVCNAGNGVPSPLLSALAAIGCEKTCKNHDQIGDDGDEDACTIEAGEKSKIEEQEGSGQGPVDISCPVDLTVESLVCVWDALVFLGQDDLVVVDTMTGGHGVVGDESKGGDEGSDDVKQAFLLCIVSHLGALRGRGRAYNWDSEGQSVENQGGNAHDNGDHTGTILACEAAGELVVSTLVSCGQHHLLYSRWACFLG